MGLAPIFVERIFEIVVEINQQGTPVLLVEQNALMALEVAQRGYVMETGRIALQGPPSELKTNEEVRANVSRRGVAWRGVPDSVLGGVRLGRHRWRDIRVPLPWEGMALGVAGRDSGQEHGSATAAQSRGHARLDRRCRSSRLPSLAIDQALKESVRAAFEPGEGVHLFGSYSIQHVQNPGVAGGGLEGNAAAAGRPRADGDDASLRLPRPAGHARLPFLVGFGLLIGGGLGNLVDRARLGPRDGLHPQRAERVQHRRRRDLRRRRHRPGRAHRVVRTNADAPPPALPARDGATAAGFRSCA